MRSLLLSALFLIACTPAAQTTNVTLFFYSATDLQNATFEHPVVVTRNIAVSDDPYDAALRMLFAGPTSDEQERGALTSDDLADLGPLYLGVRTEGSVVIVNFHPDALRILNSAAARQLLAKEPIRQTLLQFTGITDVQYAIDGKIFDEWDA